MTTIAETRDNHDFARYIEQTLALAPPANWIFVGDNLNTLCGEPLVRLVAEHLGVAGMAGGLKSMASRRALLSDPSHRIWFVYLPRHSSWLKQIEIIFGVISRRVMRRRSFTSKLDPVEKLHRFIDYFDTTMARPMA